MDLSKSVPSKDPWARLDGESKRERAWVGEIVKACFPCADGEEDDASEPGFPHRDGVERTINEEVNDRVEISEDTSINIRSLIIRGRAGCGASQFMRSNLFSPKI